VATPPSGAPVVLVFGLEDAPARWLTRRLRDHGAIGITVTRDLSTAAAQSVVSAADAGIHMFSAVQGIDGTFLEYWQLLAESGKTRFLGVHDLGPATLDVNEAAAIASRVLEEEVPPVTVPLLDDDESVIGVLDVITCSQWFPGGGVEAPRDDFTEAVALETNALFDEADAMAAEPAEAIREGLLATAVSLDMSTGAGIDWVVRHLPQRSVPAATTVLPGDHSDIRALTAGPEGIAVGAALSLTGTTTAEVRIVSLAGLLEPTLLAELPPGDVAAAVLEPIPQVGALLLTR
jgi:hypothetical protein